MGQDSKIEWTRHTFNPWIGCTKVSDGCKHCYAEQLMDKRWHKIEWGPHGARKRTSDAMWRQPLAWDRAAKAAGERHRVFCASLADVFEGRLELDEWLVDLLILIDLTPNLDWLLLTKRPENILKLLPTSLQKYPRANIWLGTSVEDSRVTHRIDQLRECPAVVRFLSLEPLLGPLPNLNLDGIGWVIVGGESGPHARPMHPDWARSIRDQCQAAGVPFFFKQWGEFCPVREWICREKDGNHFIWRAQLHNETEVIVEPGYVWNFTEHEPANESEYAAYRVGKHAAGRLLDGRTWDTMPSGKNS